MAMNLELIAVCIVSILVLILSLVFYRIFLSPGPVRKASPGKEAAAKRKRVVVLFIDSPDPDNPASAAAIYNHVLLPSQPQEADISTEVHLHIVLTGRPVDLKTSKISGGELLLESITRQSWERSDPVHAQKVLCDAAARLENYLKKCGIDVGRVTMYDGGVAPCAPISDQVHDWDFLFDRKDLVTGQEADRGQILAPEEYSVLVNEISALSKEDQEDKLLSILRPYHLAPLTTLRNKLESGSCKEIVVFLGGPATAVVKLFEGERGSSIRPKVVGLYAMFGSLEPGKTTLLPNQFNVACDIEASCDLFVNNLFPQAEKYLVTTETAKNPALVISSQDLQEGGISSYFVQLQKLWESTHKGKPQPMFDVFAVMAYLEEFRECFGWKRKKAVLQEWQKKATLQQIFRFADSDDSRHVLVSETCNPALNKASLVEFLRQTWA